MKNTLFTLTTILINLINFNLNPLVKSKTNSITKVYESDKPKSFIVKDFSFNMKSIINSNYKMYVSYESVRVEDNVIFKYNFKDEFGSEVERISKANKSSFEDVISFPFEELGGCIHVKFSVSSKIEETLFSEFDLCYESTSILKGSYEKKMYYEVSYNAKLAQTTCRGDYLKILNLEHEYLIDESYSFKFNDLNVMLYAEMFYDSFYFDGFKVKLSSYSMRNEVKKDFGPFKSFWTEINYKKIDDYNAKLFNKNKFYIEKETNNTYFKEIDSDYFETYDYYFPFEELESIEVIKLNLILENFGTQGLTITFPIELYKDKTVIVSEYEVVGKVEKEIYLEDLEEVIIPEE